jgi:prepilin-type N-terminal cleavage/methylation domain-containing protein/prepilin-type processing-associated H-X9-DG protein
MKPGKQTRRCQRGHTLLEMVFVVAIIALLATMILPVLQGARGKTLRTRCTSNLRQIGIAFFSWANEHNEKFPMSVPVQAGGSAEFAQPGPSLTLFRHFQLLSNELVDPRVLVCPADRRVAAPSFAWLHNTNISYVLNTRAEFGRVDSILAADRNLRTSGRMEFEFMQFGPGDIVEWSSTQHGFRGNVLFGDSHVDSLTMQAAGRLTNGGDVVLIVPQSPVVDSPGSTPPVTGPVVVTPTSPGPVLNPPTPTGPISVPPTAPGSVVPGNPVSPAPANGANPAINPGGSGSGLTPSAGTTLAEVMLKLDAAPPPAGPLEDSSPKPVEANTNGTPVVVGTAVVARPAPRPAPDLQALMASEFASATNRETAQQVTNSVAIPAPVAGSPSVADADSWAAVIGKWLGNYGVRLTYGLLILLLAIIAAIEFERRRRARNRAE